MEDFVPFEITKKLKEKGFPQSPDYFNYSNYSTYYDWDGLRKIHSLSNASVWFDPNISRDNIYFAPTISQVLKWLFDEKQLFVNIDCNICDKFGLFFTIYKKGEETWEACGFDDNYYNKPEEATLAGIEYVLNNLI